MRTLIFRQNYPGVHLDHCHSGGLRQLEYYRHIPDAAPRHAMNAVPIIVNSSYTKVSVDYAV